MLKPISCASQVRSMILPTAYGIWGKVMFSKVFVCSQADQPPCRPLTHLQAVPSTRQTPPGKAHPLGKADPLQVWQTPSR